MFVRISGPKTRHILREIQCEILKNPSYLSKSLLFEKHPWYIQKSSVTKNVYWKMLTFQGNLHSIWNLNTWNTISDIHRTYKWCLHVLDFIFVKIFWKMSLAVFRNVNNPKCNIQKWLIQNILFTSQKTWTDILILFQRNRN